MGIMLASMIVLWPMLALYVKRLHDFDLSGWWLVGIFAAVVVAGSKPDSVRKMRASCW